MAIVFTSEPVAKNTTTKNLDLIKAAECKLQEKSVEYTQNAEFEVLPDEGYDGMSKVNVSVDVVVPTVQASKAITITQNGSIEIIPDSDYDVMEKVEATINVPAPTLQNKHITIDKNISMTEITPDSGYGGLSRVEVDVEIPVEDNKQVSINQNGTTTIIPGDGYDYIEMLEVTVNVPTTSTPNINDKYTSLAGVTDADAGLVSGWDTLVDGTNKCYLTDFNSAYTFNLPAIETGFQMFSHSSGTGMVNFAAGSFTSLTNAHSMFDNCTVIEDFVFDMPSVGNTSSMFSECSSLIHFNSNTENLMNSSYMFQDCTALQTCKINLTNCMDMSSMFYNCQALTGLDFYGSIKEDLILSDCKQLTVDSLVATIDALANLVGSSQKTLTLGTTNLDKLTEEQKAVATGKNWILI